MQDVILKIDKFSKHFRSYWTFRPLRAIHNLSLEIHRGESFGFLGHNGAGKTTTIKSILGLLHKSSGSISFEGHELKSGQQHKQLGYLPEHPYFYSHLTVEETLDFFASLHEIRNPERKKAVADTLEVVGLTEKKKNPVGTLSKGLQQRLGFAQAVINNPKLLLLDEPFSGLDPMGRLEIRKLILKLNQQGTTVFLSSHILPDVEDICNRVGIMARGELKTVFELNDAPNLFGQSFTLSLTETPQHASILEALGETAKNVTKEKQLSGQTHELTFSSYDQAQQALREALAADLKIEAFRRSSTSLEDVFMKITREAFADKETNNVEATSIEQPAAPQ